MTPGDGPAFIGFHVQRLEIRKGVLTVRSRTSRQVSAHTHAASAGLSFYERFSIFGHGFSARGYAGADTVSADLQQQPAGKVVKGVSRAHARQGGCHVYTPLVGIHAVANGCALSTYYPLRYV